MARQRATPSSAIATRRMIVTRNAAASPGRLPGASVSFSVVEIISSATGQASLCALRARQQGDTTPRPGAPFREGDGRRETKSKRKTKNEERRKEKGGPEDGWCNERNGSVPGSSFFVLPFSFFVFRFSFFVFRFSF